MCSTSPSNPTNNNPFPHRHEPHTRTRLYTGPNPPTYQTFLTQLQDIDLSTLSPTSTCLICRTPFSKSHPTASTKNASGHQNLLALEALTFHHQRATGDLDTPVRLPCRARHLVGKACIKAWTSAVEGGGTTCPFDREALFVFGPGEKRPITTDDTDRFHSGVRRISRLPLRQLLQCFREATTEGINDVVTVNARSMTTRLASLLFRVVFHAHGISEEVTKRWTWPAISRPLYLPNEASHFRALVRVFTKDEPLGAENGQYEAHIITLLNPALPHVFALLYRIARFHQADRISLHDLVRDMQDRMRLFFDDFADVIVDGDHLRRITFRTISAWATQELLMTELRAATHRLNEWEKFPDCGVRPYFCIGGKGGMLGYHRDKTNVEVGLVPLTLPAAARALRTDEEAVLSSRSSGRSASGVGGPLTSSATCGLRSPRSDESGASLTESRESPSQSAPVQPWSPLGDSEFHS